MISFYASPENIKKAETTAVNGVPAENTPIFPKLTIAENTPIASYGSARRNFPAGFISDGCHSPRPFRQSASGKRKYFSHVNNPFNVNFKHFYSLARRSINCNSFFILLVKFL
jgi:hypothetical protein